MPHSFWLLWFFFSCWVGYCHAASAHEPSIIEDAKKIAALPSAWHEAHAENISAQNLIRIFSAPVGTSTCLEADECWQTTLIHRGSHLILSRAYEKKHSHRYPIHRGGFLYVVATQAGNHGQTWQYDSFVRQKNSAVFEKTTLQSWGIPKTILENDFLTQGPKFPPEDNLAAFFYLNDNGDFSVSPWTWMQAKWEGIKPPVKIEFQWNGRQFAKKVSQGGQ